MFFSRVRLLSLLLIFFTTSAYLPVSGVEREGQRREEKKAVPLPNPMKLEPDWWEYFNVAPDQLSLRAQQFDLRLNHLAGQVDDEKKKEEAGHLIERIAANLVLYSRLLSQKVKDPELSWIPKKQYSFSELLSLAEKVRSLENVTTTEAGGLTWQKAFLSGLKQNVSNQYALYRETPLNSFERLLFGLKVIFQRSRLAYLEREMTLRNRSLEANQGLLKKFREELDIASERIDFKTVDIASIQQQKETLRSKLLEIEKELIQLESVRLKEEEDWEITQPKEMISNLVLMNLLINEALLKTNLHYFDSLLTLHSLESKEKPDQKKILQSLQEWEIFAVAAQEQMDYWKESVGVEGELVCSSLADTESKNNGDREKCFKKILEVNVSLENLSLAIFRLDLLVSLIQERTLLTQTVGEQIGFHYEQQLLRFMEHLNHFLYYSLFDIGGVPITLMGILKVLSIYFFAILLSKILKRTIRKLNRRSQRRLAEPSVYILNRILHYVILLFATLIALSALGLTLGNLAIVLGALGIGIGFGLQNIVNNFISGLTVLFGRSIKIGDYVELSTGKLGQVKEINVQHTTIHTFDGTDIIVPNAEIVGNQLVNWTKQDPFQRLHVPFGVAYGTDQELVKEIAVEAAKKIPSTVLNTPNIPDPDVWLIKFGDNSLDFELIVWVNIHVSAGRSSMKAAYLGQIEKGLKERGVSIPFPQRDLHIKSIPPELLQRRDITNSKE